jgi:uncharacterized protein with PIN domain
MIPELLLFATIIGQRIDPPDDRGVGVSEMNCFTIRFYAELNDFLPLNQRQVAFKHNFLGHPTIKDLIESLGVPHTEVDLILVDGESVGFSRQMQDGESASVYPVFRKIDIATLTYVRPEPLPEFRFVLDTHLGRLASYLRMVGFDTIYRFTDNELAAISASERRILLTRDRGLLKRSEVAYGYCVRTDDPVLQLPEVLRRFDLLDQIRPFQRCMRCNEMLSKVSKELVLDQLPVKVRDHFNEFRLCHGCGRVYWPGTHYERMSEMIRQCKE